MHPYRTVPSHERQADAATSEPGARLAFSVMTLLGAIQVAAALPQSGPPSLQTLFGGACCLAGLAWLVRRRDR